MKNLKTTLLIALPVVVIAGVAGLFGFRYFAGTGMAPMYMAGSTTYESGPFRVTVDINPAAPQVGDNRLMVKVADARGEPVTGASIEAYGEMPAMGAMASMRAPADLDEVEPGFYAGPLNLQMRGEWPLSVSVQKDGVGETRLGFDMATGREGLSITSGGTPVAGSISPKDGMNGDKTAVGQSPEKNDRGFYTVGKYQVKIEVLGSGNIVPGDVMSGDAPEAMEAMHRGTPMMAGRNLLQVSVLDENEAPVNGATVRVATQPENGAGMQSQRNSEVVQLEAGGDGVYRGVLDVPGEGDFVLAVDVSTEELGHSDLVLAFTTGEYGLRAATATPEGVAYYTCSMHTSVRKSEPGQCPICSMDLVPVTNEQVQSGVITVDARRRQLIGVETGKAEMREVTRTIRAVGEVEFDRRRISDVSLKFDAWIGELEADYVGTRVEKGQVLFTVYSPELLSAQQEYLETRQRLASRGPNDSLVRAARKRLMLWDISPAQVRAIERRGEAFEYLPIHAPESGTVVEKMVNEGSHVKTGDTLLRIADLSTVWIDAQVYEADLPLIEKGMAADINLPYVPDQQYRAKVDYIYPWVEGKTRTARIRLVLDNPDGVLKPDMYAEVKLHADLGRRLMVPEGAVLVAGESRVVFKDLGEDGKLKPVRVKTGQRVDGWVEIREGLEPGDDVITSGNFLIAAEAKLKTGIEQW